MVEETSLTAMLAGEPEGTPEGTNDGNAATPPGEAGAEGGKTPAGSEEAEAGSPAAEAASEITDEQLQSLLSNPKVVEAVLANNQQSVEALVESLLTDKQTKAAAAEAQRVQTASLEEAIKEAEETGDTTALGTMVLEGLKRQAAEVAIRAPIVEEVSTGFYSQLDAAVSDVFGDAIDALTDEEAASLARGNFQTDREYMTAVFKALDEKRSGLLTSKQQTEVDVATQAAHAASTAAAARADTGGQGVLPGGSPEGRVLSEDIGDLLRRGIAEDYDPSRSD